MTILNLKELKSVVVCFIQSLIVFGGKFEIVPTILPQFIELAQIIVELNNEEAIMKYITERAKADSTSTKGKNRNKDITEIVKKEKEQAIEFLKST